ncbi:hypothetical protein DEO72_LG11g2144 [Vigna unguiculata]|uniref:Uncharacterized protein n=1 Tax=Vigna unguiculata TaxID=3917 RepID=A0A4D6NSA0_VIGUN|nr:hypothetical protein DEO72_LG11g2144 [Vigna unguiculata]
MAQNENGITTVNPNRNRENKLEKKEHEWKNNLHGQNMRGLGWFRGFGMPYGLALGPTD